MLLRTYLKSLPPHPNALEKDPKRLFFHIPTRSLPMDAPTDGRTKPLIEWGIKVHEKTDLHSLKIEISQWRNRQSRVQLQESAEMSIKIGILWMKGREGNYGNDNSSLIKLMQENQITAQYTEYVTLILLRKTRMRFNQVIAIVISLWYVNCLSFE